MDKKGFINPQLPVSVKRTIMERVAEGTLDFEDCLVDFIEAGYRVTFKDLPSLSSFGVNISTDNKSTGNADWILSDFHDSPSMALFRCYAYHFSECDKMPWVDGNCTTYAFDR